jgi:hypothetical protein
MGTAKYHQPKSANPIRAAEAAERAARVTLK